MQRRYARLSVALFAMFALFAALILVTSVTRADDAATETLELHPGDNFIGWVAEPIAVADIFEQVPEATLIFTWSADSRTYQHAIRDVGGSLYRLDPGMAANIRVDGDQSVQWERSLTPAKGGITLYTGVNWVAWNGRDDWPLDQVARGIGTSLISIEVEERGIVYQPGSDISEAIKSLSGESSLRRGDALRVTVNRDLRWLQPTGMMPNIVWVGDISESLKNSMTADIRDLVDYFADTHALETDFSNTTILIWDTVEHAVAYQDTNPQYPFPLGGEGLRVHLENQPAGGTAWGFVITSGLWDPNPRRSLFKDVASHEWFHALQIQLTDYFRWGRVEWMVEGTAVWFGDFGTRIDDGYQSHEESRRIYLSSAKDTAATLRSAEKQNTPWQYQLGLLAVDLLIERSGADSIVEYFRQQHPQPIGSNRQWQITPSIDDAFVAAFGLEISDFYDQFEVWREALPGRSVRDSGGPKLRGSIHDASGEPATGLWVNAAPYEGEHQAGIWRRAEVGEDGTFTLDLQPNRVQRLYFDRNGCRLWLTDEGLTYTPPALGQLRDLDTRNLPFLDLTLPEGACDSENELRLTVLHLRDDNRLIQFNLNSAEGQIWKHVAPRPSSGTYSGFAPEAGMYRIRAYLGGCLLWYGENGLVASWDDHQLVDLGEEPVDIEIRIPDDLCVRNISGRLLDEDGAAVEGIHLVAASGGMFGSASTSADGSFSITVPKSGDYVLEFGTDVEGCRIQYSSAGATSDWRRAARITVADEDVTGIEFVVPDDPASLCR